ncbi:Heme exporter protein B [Oligella urethralis]|uniref:heme exporter protein CcmB n=1 Tax=Oligella urethralis TaxID=90245 RepID=UPI00295859A8|nr:heme exporter protein CcmB [Oligella urethralis]WOS38012.1 Heme exporter protein B [Oligella urethralis]
MLFLSLTAHEVRLMLKNRSAIYRSVFFLLLVAALFPLAISGEPAFLRQIGLGVMMIAALLANLLSLSLIFEDDFQDGNLAQMLLSPIDAVYFIYSKMLAHWLCICVPLLLGALLLALQYHFEFKQFVLVLPLLCFFSLILTAIGTLAAALTVGLSQSLLPALLYIPLCVPALIFAAGALDEQNYLAHLQLLIACALFSWLFFPWASRFALKTTYE